MLGQVIILVQVDALHRNHALASKLYPDEVIFLALILADRFPCEHYLCCLIWLHHCGLLILQDCTFPVYLQYRDWLVCDIPDSVG